MMYEYTGKIESLMTDWLHKEKRMVFQVDQDAHEAMEALDGKKVTIRLCEYKKKRSLDANAYYWTLVTKLAAILLVSNAEIHNRMISSYGFPAVIGDKSVFATVPDTEKAERQVMRSETYHLQPTSQVREGVDGVTYRTYRLMRGSSTYNTAEMSRLIDGIISECKDAGIPDGEIATPDEKRILEERYGVKI